MVLNFFRQLICKIDKVYKTIDPAHKSIAHGMMWVSFFVFIGKLAGAAKEIAVAYRYGTNEIVDAYLFVFNLVNWPVGVWFSVLTVVLVPLAARIRRNNSQGLSRFRAELLGLAIFVGFALSLLAFAGLPSLINSPWAGLQHHTVKIALQTSSVLAPLVLLGILISLFSAWMLSNGRHANTLLECVPSVVILIAVLLIPMGRPEPLVWGTLAGFAFHLGAIAMPLVRSGEIEMPQFTQKSTHWSGFWQGFGIMLVGNALMSLVNIVDQFFAAHLGSGSIAVLSYANRILALILGLGATAISRATLPVFSIAQAQEGNAFNLRVATHWIRLLFVLGLVATIIGWLVAPWAVKLFFERGEFTPRDTFAVAAAFRYGLIQIPFYFSGILLGSILASQRKYLLISAIGFVNLVVKLASNYLLIPYFGLNALLVSTGLMMGISCLMSWFAVYKNSKI